MIAAAALFLLAVQEPVQPPQASDIKPSPWREMPGTPDEQERETRSPDWAYRSATCVVGNSGDKVATALSKDFRSAEYQRMFATILQNNGGCFGSRGRAPKPSLVLTGALAERVMARDATPLNARLARAAGSPAPEAQSEADAAAICTVRSIPDDVAAWLKTTPGSPESATAAQPVEMVFGRCTRDAAKTKFAGQRLRALVALAALRSVNPASN